MPDPLDEMLCGDLDLIKLGDLMVRLPLIAEMLGHSSPIETMVYLHPEDLEGQFVCEMIETMDPDRAGTFDAFLEKWFNREGGELLRRMVGAGTV